MSAFSGPQGKGAKRRHREMKRAEAETRDALSRHSLLGRRASAFELDDRRYATLRDFNGVVTRVTRSPR
jgi:hypothetical protein